LIDADVVNQHFSWELCCPIGIAQEAAADGEIQQDVKFLIERRGKFAAVGFPFGLSLSQLAIDIPTNRAFFPFQCEDMKVVGEVAFVQLVSFARVFVARPLTAIVKRAPDDIWFLAFEFSYFSRS